MAATVIDAVTGQEVPVVPVYASAAIVIASAVSEDMPSDAAVRVEKAMVAAAAEMHQQGVTDPDRVRAAMLVARDSERVQMRSEMLVKRTAGV